MKTLSSEQARFLRLHSQLVMRWQWHFGGGTLRAHAEDGTSAAISKHALGDLADAGLVECFDLAGVRLTEAGSALSQGRAAA